MPRPHIDLDSDGELPHDAPPPKRKNADPPPTSNIRRGRWIAWIAGIAGVIGVSVLIFYMVIAYLVGQAIGDFFLSIAGYDSTSEVRVVTPTPLPPMAERLCVPEHFDTDAPLYIAEITRERDQELDVLRADGERACRVLTLARPTGSRAGTHDLLRNDNNYHLIRERETGQVTMMGWALRPEWSPDDSLIAHESQESELAVYDMQAGAVTAALDMPRGRQDEFRWSETAWAGNERVVLLHQYDSDNDDNMLRISQLDIATGETTVLHDAPFQPSRTQSLSYMATEDELWFSAFRQDTTRYCALPMGGAELRCVDRSR